MLDKDISLLNMAKSISKNSSTEASKDKPLPGDKTCGIEPAIHFYVIEDGDETIKENKQKSLSFLTQALRHLNKRHQ